MRQTIDEYETGGATVRVEFDTGGPVGGDHLVTVSGEEYLVNRWFYFGEFDEQYAKNFAAKVIENPEYRAACLERTADWAQVADIYEEAARRVYDVFADAGLLGYTAGDAAAKERYQKATEAMNDLCQELFEEIKARIRGSHSLSNLDEFINQRVTAAEELASELARDT